MRPPLMPTLTSFHWMPSCRSTLRATSAILTCRFTCVGAATLRRFTTRVGSSTNWFATCTMFAACSALATVPVRTSDWSTVLAFTDWPGVMLRMPSSSASMLWVTRMRLDISTLSLSSTAKSVVSPTPTPVRYMSRGDFTSTSATSGLATKRLEKALLHPDELAGADHEVDRLLAFGCTSSKAPSGIGQSAGSVARAAASATARGRCRFTALIPCVWAYSVGVAAGAAGASLGVAVAPIFTPRTIWTRLVEVTSDSSVWRRPPVASAALRKEGRSASRLTASVLAGLSLPAVAHRIQHQREGAEGLGEGDDLGLARRDLERRGLRDRRALGLAFLVLWRRLRPEALVEGEDPEVGEHRLAGADAAARVARERIGQDQIDPVAGQREPAQAGDRVDRDGDGAHALAAARRRESRGHRAAPGRNGRSARPGEGPGGRRCPPGTRRPPRRRRSSRR